MNGFFELDKQEGGIIKHTHRSIGYISLNKTIMTVNFKGDATEKNHIFISVEVWR